MFLDHVDVLQVLVRLEQHLVAGQVRLADCGLHVFICSTDDGVFAEFRRLYLGFYLGSYDLHLVEQFFSFFGVQPLRVSLVQYDLRCLKSILQILVDALRLNQVCLNLLF